MTYEPTLGVLFLVGILLVSLFLTRHRRVDPLVSCIALFHWLVLMG